VYHENVEIRSRGTAANPVTVMSYPGELAVLDGGIPDFFDSPESAWQPLENGEFVSTNPYPGLGTIAEGRTNLLGNFTDSMIPLHGYRFRTCLQSDNHLFQKLEGPKSEKGTGLYCGPGVFYDVESGKIHVRLAHTEQPTRGDRNYRGETDPRKLRLSIAGPGKSTVTLNGASHVVLRDLVTRGSREGTINLVDCSNITLDGVTSYGGSSALRIETTSGLRCVDCAFRGIACPWLWRWSLKYRSIEARIVSAGGGWNPPARYDRDFEFAFCEFTDCVDGVFVGNVEDCRIHHSFLDDVSDDGFFVTCRTRFDGTMTGSFELRDCRISDVLSALAYGVGKGRQKTIDESGNKQMGGGLVVKNNVFDLRGEVLYQQPVEGPITTFGRVAGDHGSPAWEPMVFEGNSAFMKVAPWRGYYGAGWGKSMSKGTKRVIRNNLFVHETGLPGDVLPEKPVDFEAAGNWHWSVEAGEAGAETFLKRLRSKPLFAETGWTKTDRYGPPESAPAGCGVKKKVPVGQFGRLTIFGKVGDVRVRQVSLDDFQHEPRPAPEKRAALVLGYPAFDAPLLQFALENANVDVEIFERTWLPAEKYADYDFVAVLGNTVRAKMEPSGFSEAEFPILEKYLEIGGKLLIGRELPRFLFPGDSGLNFFNSLVGNPERSRDKPELRPLQTDHPWLDQFENFEWIPSSAPSAIFVSDGKNLIGDGELNRTILADVPVGKGRLVYMGWEASRFLPSGRKPSTLAQEANYESHYRVLDAMARDLLGLK
ncbi:MAG: hypothetical protein HKN23_21475, partial [Verrucomicrobiales bacterium]|nr:hypothetical protein [Verrucomicrobiales bacterium]